MKSIIKTLSKRNETISFVESITGGALVASLVKHHNASRILKESYVLYDSHKKAEILNFNYEIILKYGVVSKEVALEMVQGLYNKTNADLCVSSTGFADGKKPNEAFIAVKYHDKLDVTHLIFPDDNSRIKNIKECIKNTIDLIHQTIDVEVVI